MSNTTAGIILATGTAGVLVYTLNRRRRNQSLLARTRHHAEHIAGNLREKASHVSDSAAGLVAKSRTEAYRRRKAIREAILAGMAAYQRVAG